MKSVFSCSFEIAKPGLSASEIFADAAQIAREWIEEKYARPRSRFGFGHPIVVPAPGELRPLPDHLIRTDDASSIGSSLRSIIWEHPGDEPNEYWRIEICLARDATGAGITIHSFIGSRVYSLSPLNFQPGVPGLVGRLLAKLSCTLGGWRMPATCYPVVHGKVEAFVGEMLLSPARTLPVIVISRDLWSEALPVKPEAWARALSGLAEVAVLENKWAGFQLTEHLGRPLSCFGGAIRIYWPRLTLDSAPEKHRLWLPLEIEAAEASAVPLQRRLVGFLSAIAATNHVESSLVSRVRRAVEQARLDAHAATIARLRTADVPADVREIVDAYSDENKELKAQLAKARADLDEERQVSANLRTEITNHQENYLALQSASPATTAAPAPDAPLEFATVADAYTLAVEKFGGPGSPLVFLDSARKSAEESPFKSPEEVYFLIKALHDTAKRWRDAEGKLGTSWELALQPTGFEYANNISQTTENKYGEHYKFLYEGQKRLFEQHVTKGAKTKNSCFSIHMYRDEKRLVLAIGHCGNHLPNTST